MTSIGKNLVKRPVVILAGGKSRRMGQEKAEIMLDDCRMIDCVLNRISPQTDQVYISGASDYDTGCPVISDLPSGVRGPAAGILAAMNQFKKDKTVDGFFIVPVDAPLLPGDLTRKLFNPLQSQFAKGSKRTHPAFAWLRITDIETMFEMRNSESSLSLHQIMDSAQAIPVNWDSETPFHNINTPSQLAEYFALIKTY